jgi:hypothetical protein
MDNLLDFIHIHENVLSKEICECLINFYENNSEKQERYDLDGTPNFTQINLTEYREYSKDIENIHNFLIQTVFQYRNQYYEFIDSRVFPSSHAFEQFRIKKYDVGGTDRFDTHVDVVDYASSRRFLSFFWYLNDVDNGGETVFKDLTIVPKQGSMVIFPPLWMFPHKANPPISNSKYLLSTYLHYK